MSRSTLAGKAVWLLLAAAGSGAFAASVVAGLLDEAERLQRVEPEASVRAAQQALSALDEQREPEQALRAHALLCDAYSETDAGRATAHLEAGLRLSRAPAYGAWRAALLVCRGAIAEAAGRIEEAGADYHEAVGIAERRSHERFLADALFARGHLRTMTAQDAEALLDFERSMGLYEKLGQGEHARTVTNSIAALFNRTGDFGRAREYYLLAIDHLEQMNMPRDLGVALQNLGRTLENLADLPGAMEAYERSLKAQQQAGYRRGIAYARRGIASVLTSRQQPGPALEQLRAAQAAAAGTQDARLAALLALQRGRALLGLQRYAAAEPELLSAIDALASLSSQPDLRDAYQLHARLLAETGRFGEALERERAFKELSDRILAQQRDLLMDIERRRFTATLDLQQIATLKQEKEQAGQQLEQQNQLNRLQWMLLAALAVAVAAVVFALLLQRDRLRRARAAELRIRQSEGRYRQVVEHVGEGMIVVQDERIVYANPRALQITGYSMDEIGAGSFVRYVHPDDVERVRDYYERRLSGEQLPSSYEIRFRTKTGHYCWLSIGVTVVPWDGRPGTLVFFQDVTRRRTLEEELRRSLEEREAILDNAIVGMAIVSSNFRIEWASARFAELLASSRARLEGQSFDSFFADPEAMAGFARDAHRSFAASGVHEDEVKICRADGSSFWAQLSGIPIDRQHIERGAILTLLDVTARHAAEQETRDALARQKELNELKSRFVSMTSHEFRTPLTTILSAAELLRHYREKLPQADREEVFDSIENSVRRMTQMLDNVLLLGRIDSRMLRFEPRPVDAQQLCEAIAREACQAHSASGSTLETRLDVPRDPLLLDERLLRHILNNLLGNAFKYSPAGSVVSFAARYDDGTLYITVADRGIGIPAAELPRLFEAFHRASNVGNIPGTGLGLSIVKQAVELHGGQVRVDSEPGRGTTFSATLRAAPVPGAGELSVTG